MPHTLWMDDNREDLIILIRVYLSNNFGGVQRGFFENYAGILRDQHTSIWQMLLLFENAQAYPVSLPLSLAKIMVKTGAFIGQLLGYRAQYEAYTTVD